MGFPFKKRAPLGRVHGEAGWGPVKDAFVANFDAGSELGASVCVTHHGQTVVDLWAGDADPAGNSWASDTIVNVWSTTKMMAALCILRLHDRGVLSVDDPVASYWPEFAANQKQGVLVRHVLSHTAGVAGYDQPITEEEVYDVGFCAARLAGQAPWWEPGTASGYHSSTQGILLGELVRRVDGRTLGNYFREEIAGPLGADFHIGTPESVLSRIAEMRTDEIDVAIPAGDTIRARVARGEPSHASMVNTDRWRQFEQPAGNGPRNARSVARIVSCLARGGEVDGHRVLSPATIERCFEVQADGPDHVLDRHAKFGIGFAMPSPDMPVGINDRTLWWGGWGGSMAVVDVENAITVVYVMNRMMDDLQGGLRAGLLVFAAHAAGRAQRGG